MQCQWYCASDYLVSQVDLDQWLQLEVIQGKQEITEICPSRRGDCFKAPC